MSALLFVSLAAAVTPAAPVAANSWFTSKEYSKTALAVAQRGHVAWSIDVGPDGAPLRCVPQGDSDLDRKVCDIVMKKARFTPAQDGNGQPAFARYDGMSSFLMPGKSSRPDRSKLTVAVDSLPQGVTAPAYANVAFLVDTAGAISQCAATAGERRRFFQTVEALGPAACDNLVRSYRPGPARDGAGAPVLSVQSAMVRFDVRQSAQP